MEAENPRRGLNSNQIKLIAIAAMTIDHVVWALFPGLQTQWYVIVLHIIGRITAPVMWFFVAEGCAYTKDIKKYALRMGIFAVVSHFAYCFAFGIPFLFLSTGIFNQTSVMLSLTLAVILTAITRDERIKPWVKYLSIFAFCIISFPADWSSVAVMAPVSMYMHRDNRKKQMLDIILWSFIYAAVYFLFLDKVYGLIQMCTFISIPILMLYNGQRGKWKGMKWFYYLYYPIHLILVGLIRILIHGDISVIF